MVNPMGEETAIRLDDARNVVSLSRNGSVVQSMEYDSEHRRTVAGTGTDVHYKYDPAIGALVGIDSGNGPARTFGYDGNGNLGSAVTDDGLHRYGFSSSGDLTTYSTQSLEFSFAPDSDGLIASMKEIKDATSLGYKAGGELQRSVSPMAAKQITNTNLLGFEQNSFTKTGGTLSMTMIQPGT